MDGQTKTKPSGLKEWKPSKVAGYYVVRGRCHIEAHVWQGHEHDRLLPTSMRETRFFAAYSHPYDGT